MKILTVLMLVSVTKQGTALGGISESSNIINGEGKIRTRNFLHEYGKTANSLWKFMSHWQNYGLVVSIQRLRLFYWDGYNQICLGSYNLTINGDQENCTEFVLEREKRYVFYNSPTCLNVSSIASSPQKKLSNFPLEIQYESDGRTLDGGTEDNDGQIWGFSLKYKFIKCPDSPYVTTEAATTPDVTTMGRTTSNEAATTEAEHSTDAKRMEEYSTTELMMKEVQKKARFIASEQKFFTTEMLKTTTFKYYEEARTKMEVLDARVLTIILELGAAILGIAVIVTLAFGCNRRKKKRNPRKRRQSEAPLFDKLTYGLDSPSSPTEQAFAYSVNEVRTLSRCSDDRRSNHYASIHEENWREPLDYVTMAELEDENGDGNAVYASVTFNPNVSDLEISEYTSMGRNQSRENRYEDWPRHASVPAPIYTRPKSLIRDNSVYVIVRDNQNNNEYVIDPGFKKTGSLDPTSRA